MGFVTPQTVKQESESVLSEPVAVAPIKVRGTLVPKEYNLPVTDDRILKIFLEMKGLSVKKYVNTAAIMLRIF